VPNVNVSSSGSVDSSCIVNVLFSSIDLSPIESRNGALLTSLTFIVTTWLSPNSPSVTVMRTTYVPASS